LSSDQIATLASINRYWNTLKYLRFTQVVFRFRKFLPKRSIQRGNFPAPRLQTGTWIEPIPRERSLISRWTFCFLGVQKTLSISQWNSEIEGLLWRYNLHYFDDLNAADASARYSLHKELISDWVQNNAIGDGVGWEPYPTSLRIVNWIKWTQRGTLIESHWQTSLVEQTRWLYQNIEWHLLGNHLFANAKALIYAGLFFAGSEAEIWLKKGLSIISIELTEQILDDGGHFELSPMYHCIILEDVLDLINLAQVHRSCIPEEITRRWCDIASRMLRWLSEMSHPDGEISFFNDATLGIAPNLAALSKFAQELRISVSALDSALALTGLRSTRLPQSGYVRLQSSSAVALLDCARIGPDYLPGHSHADTLSFELSVKNQRLVVNGGTSQYGLGLERLEERSTSAHSTLECDGLSSSEVWSGFRVARRAYPVAFSESTVAGEIHISSSHNGYRWLKGRPQHTRRWIFSEKNLRVLDRLVSDGSYRNAGISRFVFHPSIGIEFLNAQTWLLSASAGSKIRLIVESGTGHIVPGYYAPAFGARLPTKVLEVKLILAECAVFFVWD
jgi:uncharacterized heparinase superfamily protein